VGVAVWEAADRREAPAGAHALLLHGLYVIPRWQGCGTGTRLLEFVQSRAAAHGFDGIVLRAWRESEAFFRARGFSPLAADQAVDRHPLRLWRPSA
jgi:GNAT superfamily N-acetyltransferase